MLVRTPQAFINACFTLLWKSGYSATIDMDLRGWVKFLKSVNPNGLVNAAFNPEYHRLEPDNSFWVAIRRQSDGEIVACICDRLIESDDYLEEQRSMRLYYGDHVAELGAEPLELAQPRSAFPDVQGKIGHHGGLWVAETERHNGLAWLLCRLTRAMTLERWPDTGWHCGNTLGHVEKRGLPKNTYGYTGCDLMYDGWFHLTNQHQKVFMTSINQTDMMAQIAEDLLLVEMHAKEQVRDVVRAARERQSDAPVLAVMAG